MQVPLLNNALIKTQNNSAEKYQIHQKLLSSDMRRSEIAQAERATW